MTGLSHEVEPNIIKRSLYMIILDSLEAQKNEIQSRFTDRANVNGNIQVDQVSGLISDLNVLFSSNLDETWDSFVNEVERIENISTSNNEVSFEDFMQLLRNWLESKTGRKSTDPLPEKEEEVLSIQKTLSIGNRANTARKIIHKASENHQQTMAFPENYQRNKERLNELLKKHEATFRETFQLRQDPNLSKIALVDHFIFLQDCFYEDTTLLMERKSDDDDFFSSVNSYKRLSVVAENFFANVREITKQGEYDPKKIFLTFEECFEILDYWFKTDDQVILIDESEKSKAEHQNIDQTNSEVISENGIPQDVKSLLLDTISKYKVMMTNSDKDVEKLVLQTTIETLYKKINMLETGIPEEPVAVVDKPSVNVDIDKGEDETLKKSSSTRILKALKDIFEFYSKQHLRGLKSSTFEEMERQYNRINISKFSVILKRFLIKAPQHKVQERFRRISSNGEDLNFQEFSILLQMLANDFELIKRPRLIQKNPDIMKNYKPDSYKQLSILLKENESATKQEHKSHQEKIQELWEHMGLEDGSYKKNLVAIQAPNNPDALKNRQNLFKHKFQPKVLNQKLDLEELSLSPKNKLTRAARALPKETPPKLELKIRNGSSDESGYHQRDNNNSILKTHRAKLHLPAFTRRFQRRLYTENDDQIIQTDRAIQQDLAGLRISTENDVKKVNISESYTPETKKKLNYQKQFSQPGGGSKIKPLNFNQLEQRNQENSSSPKMRRLKDMHLYDDMRQNEKAQTERYHHKAEGVYIQILERANEIDHNSKQKESEIMKNLINLQNTKLKQGLFVARR